MSSQDVPSDKDSPMAAFIRETIEMGDILHVLGEVDLANVGEFETAIQAIADEPLVIVDLTGCNYMDSSGLRALAGAHKDVGDRLRLIVPQNGSVHRIFEITGLAVQFNACDNLDQALAKKNGQPAR